MAELAAARPFRPTPPDTFWTGLNYWPASSAMFWWSEFDSRAAREDLERIAAAGFSHVRFFLLWEAFQPEPEVVSGPILGCLEQFANLAERLELRLQPTLFTGHMSGANWLPEFATLAASSSAADNRQEKAKVKQRFPTIVRGRAQPRAAANFYVDERLIQAQELLAREVARVLAKHPAMWSWDLGNEHSNVATPPRRDDARRWLARMIGALRAGGSEHPVTIGLHMEDLEEDRRLGPVEAAEACDYLCMHGYPLYASWARDNLDTALLPFLGLVTRWLGNNTPVLFQEFGLPTRTWGARGRESGQAGERVIFDERDGADFYRAALADLRREQLLGAFAWCAFDYAEHLWNRPPLAENEHERFFGLFRADGSAKAVIQPWYELHADLSKGNRPPEARATSWIDSDPDRFWRSPLSELRRLYAKFLSL